MTKPILTSRRQARPSATRRAAGFTLMELMVSVAIMAIIMLAFGGLLNQANKVVTEGEQRMRSDAAASAIARIVRNDIRKMTKNGFLRVGGSEDKGFFLVIVTAGKTQSSFGNEAGDGAIIVYGRHEDSKVLFRRVFILAKEAVAAKKVQDCLIWNGTKLNERTGKGMNLADLQVLEAAEMEKLIAEATDQTNLDIAFPPETLYQVQQTMWMVLAGGCTDLLVEHRAPGQTNWKENSVIYTRHNQASWPTAIKFTFELNSDSLVGTAISDRDDKETNEDGKRTVKYEIVTQIGH